MAQSTRRTTDRRSGSEATGEESETGNHPDSVITPRVVAAGMTSNPDRALAGAVVDLARERVADHLREERRAGRTVVTLVELSQATALDPHTAEAAMESLADDPDRAVRRSTADPHRWYLRG